MQLNFASVPLYIHVGRGRLFPVEKASELNWKAWLSILRLPICSTLATSPYVSETWCILYKSFMKKQWASGPAPSFRRALSLTKRR